MSKRITPEETIVDFFNTSDLGKVETLFNVVKGIIKTRTAGSKTATKTVSTRRNKAAVSTTVASSAPAQESAAA